MRERRLIAGLKQAKLAEIVGISPSYLNLIEHNRRRIGGKLLLSMAEALEVEPHTLSQGAEASILEDLHTAARQRGSSIAELDRAEEFENRFPGWAQLVAEQRKRIDALERRMEGLSDRFSHDPVLSETMHDVLSTVSAIRSTAAILIETPDIDADWRARFHANIDTESRRLAQTSASMAAHFDQLAQVGSSHLSPLEDVQSLFERADFSFPEIEAEGAPAIDAVLEAAELKGHEMARATLADYAALAERLPLEAFEEALQEIGYRDPAALAARFDLGLGDVLRRLGHLPTDPRRPEIGYITCDNSGTVLARRAAPGFAVPRLGAGCPLWPLYGALNAPGQAVRRLVESSDGARFETFALAERQTALSFDGPSVYVSTMVLVGASDDKASSALRIGASCRICPHANCDARREPSILDTFS